jgi:hypothetical protein
MEGNIMGLKMTLPDSDKYGICPLLCGISFLKRHESRRRGKIRGGVRVIRASVTKVCYKNV